jgi:hypothetical protein
VTVICHHTGEENSKSTFHNVIRVESNGDTLAIRYLRRDPQLAKETPIEQEKMVFFDMGHDITHSECTIFSYEVIV